MLFAVIGPVRRRTPPSIEAGFVEWFKDIERSEQKCARAAGGIEDGDLFDGVPEGAKQFRAFAVFDDILRELADVEIERDEVVDVADFAGSEFLSDFFDNAVGGRRLRARFRWAAQTQRARACSSRRAWKRP